MTALTNAIKHSLTKPNFLKPLNATGDFDKRPVNSITKEVNNLIKNHRRAFAAVASVSLVITAATAAVIACTAVFATPAIFIVPVIGVCAFVSIAASSAFISSFVEFIFSHMWNTEALIRYANDKQIQITENNFLNLVEFSRSEQQRFG